MSLIIVSALSLVLFGLCALLVALTSEERRALFAVAAPGVLFFRQLFQIAPKGSR